MPKRSEFLYVYGVAPATAEFSPGVPAGLEDAPVERLIDGELAAIASRLDGQQYAPSAVERGTENVEWLAPRAVAHDRVLTWMSDRGPIVPLPIFSMFSGEQAVRQMLSERRTELVAALRHVARGREYALRVYRIDSELSAIATELSPRLAELQQSAASASPGQRYLLERKLDTERKNELHGLGARIAREMIDALRPFAIETAETRLAPRTSRSTDGVLILDVAFLVASDPLISFQQVLTEIVGRHSGRGFRFDFTGPWPPYHFVQEVAAGTDDDRT